MFESEDPLYCPNASQFISEEVKFAFTHAVLTSSRNRPGVAQRVPGSLGSQILWHSAHEDGQVVRLTHRPPLPPGMSLVLNFTRGWVDPRTMVRSEGNMSPKNPVTPPGIDPGTVRPIAQRLNHYATPGPQLINCSINNYVDDNYVTLLIF